MHYVTISYTYMVWSQQTITMLCIKIYDIKGKW